MSTRLSQLQNRSSRPSQTTKSVRHNTQGAIRSVPLRPATKRTYSPYPGSSQHRQHEEELECSSYDSTSSTLARKTRGIRARENDEESQTQHESDSSSSSPENSRKSLHTLRIARPAASELEEEDNDSSEITFNTQGHMLGHATGARRLGTGFNGRRDTDSRLPQSQQNDGNQRPVTEPRAYEEVLDGKEKYRPLRPYDKSLYNEVKARMWWELGLFQNAFPTNGTSQDFMVKIWVEGLTELDIEDRNMTTPAEEILSPKNGNISYKLMKSFNNNRACRKERFHVTVHKIFPDLVTDLDPKPEQLEKVKAAVANLVGKDDTKNFSFHKSTHRYYNPWLPALVHENFLLPGMYHFHRETVFCESLNSQFVALCFAMVELNIKECASGVRTVPRSKRTNPLKALYEKHLDYFNTAYPNDVVKEKYFYWLQLSVMKIYKRRTPVRETFIAIEPPTADELQALDDQLSADIADLKDAGASEHDNEDEPNSDEHGTEDEGEN